MAFYRSTSIRQVILIGFSVATLPLVSALVTAVITVDRLTTQGQQAIFAATSTTRSSRMLVEDITAMERHARQYHVLKDPQLLGNYRERHEQFQRHVDVLLRQNITAPLHNDLRNLSAEEQSLYNSLRDASPGSPEAATMLDRFRSLGTLARTILAESSHIVGREAENMQRAAGDVRRLLLWLTLLLIVLAFVLAAIFMVLITRPLRQINQAIRQLGDGEFSGSIRITGPDDLVSLGARLEWLRLRLIQLERQKVNFLRHISHELKTPLASIREGVGLLKDRVVGPLNEEQAEVANILQQNSLQLQRLIEDLINFSIVELPTPLSERRVVSVQRLLRRLVHDQKLAAKAKNLTFNLDLTDANVTGDEEKLRVIFDNLLSNAVKYSPSAGTITIAARREGARVVVDVRDEGPGIDPDEREKIFEAFYQGRAIAKGHIKGSGLGLSIAHEYVKLHTGSIEALATASGAHLRVSLPAALQTTSRQELAESIHS